MTEHDNQKQLTDKHRSGRPQAESGKETTHPVGYMAGRRMRNLALHGALTTVQAEFTPETMPDKLTLYKMAASRYRDSLKSKPADGMLG